MTTNPSSESQPDAGGKSLLATAAKPLLLAVIAGIGGVITTVMTPLSDVVSAAIWPSAPEIRISPTSITAKQGDLVRVELFLYPTTKVAIPTGNLTVTYPQQQLQLGAENSAADLVRVTDEVKTLLKVYGDKPLEFVAALPGEGEISAEFKTTSGVSAHAVTKVIVEPAETATKPTYSRIRGLWNITGKWKIIVAGAPGEMDIVDEGNNVKGSYKLTDGRTGTVDGWHDGDSFNFYLSRGTDNPTQLWAKGPFKKGPASELQIDGSILLRTPAPNTPTGWTEETFGNGQFSANAVM